MRTEPDFFLIYVQLFDVKNYLLLETVCIITLLAKKNLHIAF